VNEHHLPADLAHEYFLLTPNTVNLGSQDGYGLAGLLGGLGPVAVLGPLDAPSGHLALDDAWLGARPALG
jgi:hypothetical protein